MREGGARRSSPGSWNSQCEEPDQGEQEAMWDPVEGREQGVGAVGGWEVRADQRAS